MIRVSGQGIQRTPSCFQQSAKGLKRHYKSAMQKQLGVWAEQQAAQLMQQQDFQLIARNWHSLYGELDLVMQREQELVFVE